MVLFRSLSYRPFALLWAGQTVSRIGDYLYQIALAWWVLEKTGSAAAMGMVLICSYAPMLLFLLIGGVAVDRLPRVQVLLASDLGRGAVVTAVAALAFLGWLEVWHVLTASLLFGFVDAFFQPAYTALVPEVARREHLPSANALSSMSHQLGRILGPALGVAVIALGGTASAFAFDAASFFVSAACLAPLFSGRTGRARPEQMQATSVRRDLREGIDTILRAPVLWITILVFALSNITFGGLYNVALPFLVNEQLSGGVQTLGLLYAIFSIGYVVGGVWLGRLSRLRRRGPTTFVALMIAGLMFGTFGLPMPLIGLVLAAVVNGVALEVAGLTWTNILQEIVPADRLGRVASIDSLGSYALLPFGFALVGWTTELFGPVLVISGGSLLAVVCGALALAHPAVRGLD
jgi:DHA3 family tetracycline resistance protein-like MFS transporter